MHNFIATGIGFVVLRTVPILLFPMCIFLSYTNAYTWCRCFTGHATALCVATETSLCTGKSWTLPMLISLLILYIVGLLPIFIFMASPCLLSVSIGIPTETCKHWPPHHIWMLEPSYLYIHILAKLIYSSMTTFKYAKCWKLFLLLTFKNKWHLMIGKYAFPKSQNIEKG